MEDWSHQRQRLIKKDDFNIGIGQLIAMKKNEIEIRKIDIKSMIKVSERLKELSKTYNNETAHKLYVYYDIRFKKAHAL